MSNESVRALYRLFHTPFALLVLGLYLHFDLQGLGPLYAALLVYGAANIGLLRTSVPAPGYGRGAKMRMEMLHGMAG